MLRNSGTGKRLLGFSLLSALVFVAVLGIALNFPSSSNQGYAPEQPIPFSHRLHAGTNKIDCRYCHSTVEQSRHASVPELKKCFNCHSVVKTDSPHIQKMRKSLEEGRPIEWVRVHELPDFVYFSHKRHVARGVACETCHGNVREMERLEQVEPLTMGWCMDCHRGKTTPKSVLTRIYPNMKDPHGAVAKTECTTCHQ